MPDFRVEVWVAIVAAGVVAYVLMDLYIRSRRRHMRDEGEPKKDPTLLDLIISWFIP